MRRVTDVAKTSATAVAKLLTRRRIVPPRYSSVTVIQRR
jgi:hypothetical protein